MAIELAFYEKIRKLIVHRASCTSYSSVERKFQTSSIVRIPEGWFVVRCGACQPDVHVVMTVQRRIHSTSTSTPVAKSDNSERWDNKNGPQSGANSRKRISYWRKQLGRNNPDSSFPPYGVTALDITKPGKKEEWWHEANCKSRDERLGPWLEWLFASDHTEHWTLTVQKVVCSECPVRAECLEQGVWGNEVWGTWGGANVRERKLLRAKWVNEGRVDERPNRPRNATHGQHHFRSENGGRVAATRGDNRHGDSEEPRDSETTSEDVSEVRAGQEVRWPRGYQFAGSGWSSEGSGRG